ncbi:MAG: GyrI-like domain-containing protein [Flavobacteriaceae bacterium]|nr:GyrI-like domain-containing protein [Flavobacteriaceae bacterium]
MKHEWRKKEKSIYLPKTKPETIDIPEYKFITIEGEGSPSDNLFSECIGALYPIAYAIKMNLKIKETKPKGYYDYTVYPLEGVWDINEESKKNFNGTINKDDFVYKLMIRQPEFVDESFFKEMLLLTQNKKQNRLLDKVKFENIKEGKCVQMLHIGSYDDEAKTFELMEKYAEKENIVRRSKVHKEVYLSDFRRVPIEKIKTILRFKVKQ